MGLVTVAGLLLVGPTPAALAGVGRHRLANMDPRAGLLLIAFSAVFYLWYRYMLRRESRQTEKLVKALSQRDPAWNPEELKSFAAEAFVRVKTATSQNDVEPVRDLLTEHAYEAFKGVLSDYRQRHLRHVVENIKVNEVKIVHAANYVEDHRDEFTVFISYKSTNYWWSDKEQRIVYLDENGEPSPIKVHAVTRRTP